MTSSLHTPRRQAIVDKVADLGPRFAQRAEQIDREATFPFENWDDLTAAGLLGIVVPEHAGGLGGDFVTYALASEELGRHCATTGLTFNMHVATTLLVGEISDMIGLENEEMTTLETRRRLLWKGVIEQNHMHSQPFSEGTQAGATAGYATRAAPVDAASQLSRAGLPRCPLWRNHAAVERRSLPTPAGSLRTL
ncbi:MAG: alkylation response protein AidB-like acyl-CoA dehydrogenase [Acidimicrobiales bacterium]|jgi:alkylation response protein AidB-like acyl-CoA dehydrogenase